MAIKTVPQLDDRIGAIREEINAIIDGRVREIKIDCPGVPDGSIRRMITAQNTGCECRQYLDMFKPKDEAA